MIQSLGILSRFGYAVLYLPSGTFGYLYWSTTDPSVTAGFPFVVLNQLIPFVPFTIPTTHLLWYAGAALLGGAWIHYFGILVHGLDGPAQRPKFTKVINKQMVGLSLNVDVEKLPDTDSKTLLVTSAVSHLSWWSLPTFLIFVPAGFFKLFLYLSTWLLATGIPLQSLNLSGGALLLVNGAFISRDIVRRFFPTYIPEDAVSRLDTAEYKLSGEQYEELESEQTAENKPTHEEASKPN